MARISGRKLKWAFCTILSVSVLSHHLAARPKLDTSPRSPRTSVASPGYHVRTKGSLMPWCGGWGMEPSDRAYHPSTEASTETSVAPTDLWWPVDTGYFSVTPPSSLKAPSSPAFSLLHPYFSQTPRRFYILPAFCQGEAWTHRKLGVAVAGLLTHAHTTQPVSASGSNIPAGVAKNSRSYSPLPPSIWPVSTGPPAMRAAPSLWGFCAFPVRQAWPREWGKKQGLCSGTDSQIIVFPFTSDYASLLQVGESFLV